MAVTVLQHSEQLQIDPDRITELHVKLGQHGAGEKICAAMECLASLLADLRKTDGFADRARVRAVACNIRGLAAQIGLTGLARAALDVDYCLRFGDEVALASTFARLIRVGQISLTAIWDQQDLSV